MLLFSCSIFWTIQNNMSKFKSKKVNNKLYQRLKQRNFQADKLIMSKNRHDMFVYNLPVYNICKSPQFMDFQPQIIQALKQLPPAERVVALALKNIYEKIRGLYEKEKSEIDSNRLQFTDRYRQLEANVKLLCNTGIKHYCWSQD